jgi:acyl-CoA thioester hydrolase
MAVAGKGQVHEKRIEIRWRDMDAFGHVNNAVFLTYLEEVRDEWLEGALAGAGDPMGFVLAGVTIRYRRPLTQGDDMVTARCWSVKLGRSSIHTRESLETSKGEIAAQAESVIVAIDRNSGRARPLAAAERSALERTLSPRR